MGMAAACSSVSACGLGATRYDGVVTKAASAEGAIAMTASPGLNASTSAPTAVTRPAHSAPSGTIPGGTPGQIPSAFKTSLKFRPAATTSICTSPADGGVRSHSVGAKLFRIPGWVARIRRLPSRWVSKGRRS